MFLPEDIDEATIPCKRVREDGVCVYIYICVYLYNAWCDKQAFSEATTALDRRVWHDHARRRFRASLTTGVREQAWQLSFVFDRLNSSTLAWQV